MAKKKATEKKLSKDWLTKLSEVGIKSTTESAARKEMLEFLAKNDIDDVEDDSFDDLYDMVEAMYDESEEILDDAAEEEVEEEEEEEDDSAEEEEEDEEEEEEDEEEDEDEEDEDEEEEDEDEEEAEEVEKKNDKKQKKVAKKVTKKTTKEAKSKGAKKVSKRLNPKENPEDAAKYDGLKEVLGEEEFEFNFIANGGVSIKHLGKNSKKVLLSFDSPKVTKDGEIVGTVYLSSVRDEDTLQELFGEDIEIKKSWSGNLLVTGMSLEELIENIEENRPAFDKVISRLSKKDEKLGKNRKKMEDDLKKDNKEKAKEVKSKKTTKKATTTKKTTAKKKSTKK